MNREFLELIKTRRSCRKYKPEQITDEELQAVLEAGTYAPTSRDMQSYLPVMSPEMSSSEQEAIHVIRKRVAIRLLARRNHLFRRMDCELSVFIV